MGKTLTARLKQERFDSAGQEAVLNLFVTGHFLKTKYEAVTAGFGITGAQYNVLRILKGALPDGYPRCEIISRMIEPAPDVTRLIDRLIKEGLVERYTSSEDRRLSLARITLKGIKLLDNMKNSIKKFDNFLLGKLSEEECQMLSSLCEKIYNNGS